jgi:hypothetical protein
LCVSPPAEVARSLLGHLHETSVDGTTPATGSDVDASPYVPVVDASAADAPATVRLLLSPDDADAVLGRFTTAAVAADLRREGHLAVAVVDGLSQRLTLTGDAAHVHLRPDGRPRSISAEAPSLCRDLRERYERRLASVGPRAPEVPGWRELTETFREAFPAAGETLRAVLADAPELPVSGEFDAVTVVGLVAARHGLQTMAVSEWAESVDLSSRTELSRVKSRLADRGLVDTDRVPQGVGRPRQKLLLAADRLRECPPEEFVDHARELYDGSAETAAGGR